MPGREEDELRKLKRAANMSQKLTGFFQPKSLRMDPDSNTTELSSEDTSPCEIPANLDSLEYMGHSSTSDFEETNTSITSDLPQCQTSNEEKGKDF